MFHTTHFSDWRKAGLVCTVTLPGSELVTGVSDHACALDPGSHFWSSRRPLPPDVAESHDVHAPTHNVGSFDGLTAVQLRPSEST